MLHATGTRETFYCNFKLAVLYNSIGNVVTVAPKSVQFTRYFQILSTIRSRHWPLQKNTLLISTQYRLRQSIFDRKVSDRTFTFTIRLSFSNVCSHQRAIVRAHHVNQSFVVVTRTAAKPEHVYIAMTSEYAFFIVCRVAFTELSQIYELNLKKHLLL